jgi:hypothetical protein
LADIGRQHQQTVINLYNSGILPDIISMQLDIGKNEVYQVIKNQAREEQRRQIAVKQVSDASSLGSIFRTVMYRTHSWKIFWL